MRRREVWLGCLHRGGRVDGEVSSGRHDGPDRKSPLDAGPRAPLPRRCFQDGARDRRFQFVLRSSKNSGSSKFRAKVCRSATLRNHRALICRCSIGEQTSGRNGRGAVQGRHVGPPAMRCPRWCSRSPAGNRLDRPGRSVGALHWPGACRIFGAPPGVRRSACRRSWERRTPRPPPGHQARPLPIDADRRNNMLIRSGRTSPRSLSHDALTKMDLIDLAVAS
jgi:hypothetical protein